MFHDQAGCAAAKLPNPPTAEDILTLPTPTGDLLLPEAERLLRVRADQHI